MIDPIGPDPADPAVPSRQVADVIAEFEARGPVSPLRPKVRYADYDSPEAQILKPTPLSKAKSRIAEILPRKSAAPVIQEAPDSAAAAPPLPRPTTAAPKPEATTALGRLLPPKPSKLERAVSVAKTVLPLVGKMLPLLEGNVVGAATNLLAHRPAQGVDLKPLEDSIASLQSDQRALTFHASEQKRAIQRLQDEFDTVQQAVQKQAEVQAELVEHVAKLAKRNSSFMRTVTILLSVLILFTALLCVRIAYLIR